MESRIQKVEKRLLAFKRNFLFKTSTPPLPPVVPLVVVWRSLGLEPECPGSGGRPVTYVSLGQ